MAISDPRDISGLVAWYSPEYEATQSGVSDGAALNTIHDISGNANHLINPGSGSGWVFKATDGSGGGPAFRCDATTMREMQMPSGILTGATAAEIAVRIKANAANNCGLWAFGSIAGSNDGNYYPHSGVLYNSFGLSTGNRQSWSYSDAGNWHNFDVYAANNDWQAFIDGSSVKTFTTGGAVSFVSAPSLGRIGASGSMQSTDWFKGWWGGIVLYNRKLTSTERGDLDAWMTAHPSGGMPDFVVAGAVASETDTPLAGTTDSPTNVAGAVASETDTALAGVTVGPVTGGLALENDEAMPGLVLDFDWQVFLRVGDHTWTIDTNDVIDPDDPVQVLDGLRIGWEVTESDPWPAQPQPVNAGVGFYTVDVAELNDVTIGTPMHVILTDPLGNVIATMHGRVSELNANPIKRKAGLRMLWNVSGVDYTVDLDEEPVTIDTTWPAESADDRFGRIVDLAATIGITLVPPVDTGSAAFEALDATSTTIGTLIRDHLSQIAIDGDHGPERYIVAPVIVADELDHFECVLLPRTTDAGLLPGTFEILDGLFTLVFLDEGADGVVSAGDVELDTTWNRLKYRAVNRVNVAGDTVTVEFGRTGPPVRLNLDTTLTDVDAAERMAQLYLPDSAEAIAWVAESFQFLAYRDQTALLPAWFADHRDDPPSAAAYVRPVAVIAIPSNINLAGDLGIYSGQLATVDLRFGRGRLYVDFGLRRQTPIGIGGDAATWEWAQTEFPTIEWDEIDPELSWYEARLGRAT